MATDSQGNLARNFGDRDRGDLTPGQHLRAEIERLGLDQVEVSRHTGVSRQSINNIVNDRQPISRAMAGKLGELTGQNSDYWMRSSFPRMSSTAVSRMSDSQDASPHPIGSGVLVNHQIVRAVKEGTIVIEPFDERNVQFASIDLTLDDFIITTKGAKIDISDGQVFALKSGRSVIVSPREWVRFPMDHLGRVGAMASLARTGLITSHGFQVDPGFEGNLTFGLFNAGEKDFELRSSDPIISLEIVRLSVPPAEDERALRQLVEAGDRQKVISIFSGQCNRLIRSVIRAKVRLQNDSVAGATAGIPELGIELSAPSADSALDAVVTGALNGLKVLRDHPNTARDAQFSPFFAEITEQLQLNAAQAREAVTCLGLTVENDIALLVNPRGGGQNSLIYLPTQSATIGLKRLAAQLHEDPSDLILILAGLRNYPDP